MLIFLSSPLLFDVFLGCCETLFSFRIINFGISKEKKGVILSISILFNFDSLTCKIFCPVDFCFIFNCIEYISTDIEKPVDNSSKQNDSSISSSFSWFSIKRSLQKTVVPQRKTQIKILEVFDFLSSIGSIAIFKFDNKTNPFFSCWLYLSYLTNASVSIFLRSAENNEVS